MTSFVRRRLSSSSGTLLRALIGCQLTWIDREVFANTEPAAPVEGTSATGQMISFDGVHVSIDISLLIVLGYFIVACCVLLPAAYRYLRAPKGKFWIEYWNSFRWFKLTNLLAVPLTALWIAFLHKEIGESLGHTIPVYVLLHMVIAAFEHHLRLFAETPKRITETIREEIDKSIGNQSVYVSGLQAAGIDDILVAIRHKRTLENCQHGFALSSMLMFVPTHRFARIALITLRCPLKVCPTSILTRGSRSFVMISQLCIG